MKPATLKALKGSFSGFLCSLLSFLQWGWYSTSSIASGCSWLCGCLSVNKTSGNVVAAHIDKAFTRLFVRQPTWKSLFMPLIPKTYFIHDWSHMDKCAQFCSSTFKTFLLQPCPCHFLSHAVKFISFSISTSLIVLNDPCALLRWDNQSVVSTV